MRVSVRTDDGFTLLEVLIAATSLLVSLSALAQLLAVSALTTRRARVLTYAAVLAQQKIEALLPQVAADTGLLGSPPNTLSQNVDGYVDFLDADGVPVGIGANASPVAAYIRRWAIEPTPAATAGVAAVRVFVFDAYGAGGAVRISTLVRRMP